MKQYVGLDVSMKETSICIVDKEGEVLREVKVATEPTAILAVLMDETLAIERIGLEAGAFSQWLYGALAEADLPVVCVETRHMKAALSAQRNKTDRSDARGIAQMMRVGLYRPVHVKTMTSQKQRMLLTARQLLKAKAIDIESELRGTLRNFGLKVGMVGEAKFEARIRELIEDDPDLAEIVEPVLIARRSLREQLRVLHRKLLELVRHDQICRRLMTAPGVGPVVALTFRATVDVPSRFKSSKTIGAAFGLTPRQYQSGETDRMGAVSKCGDRMMRDVVRGCFGFDGLHPQMVVAQGMGHEDCAASRNEARDRGGGAAARGHPAPHVGGWDRLSLDQTRSCSGTQLKVS